MSGKSNRREFLRTTALTGFGVWVATRASADDKQSANDKINFACIGVGGKGDSDTADAARLGNLYAICDVDENTLNSDSSVASPKLATAAILPCRAIAT